MSGITAIVIDDDTMLRELFVEILHTLEIDVLETGSNGNDAVRLYREKSPSLVFLDVHMSELNGIDALTEIKKINPKANVIMVTGDTNPELESILESLNASALICKPFTIQRVTEVLETIKHSKTMIIQKTLSWII